MRLLTKLLATLACRPLLVVSLQDHTHRAALESVLGRLAEGQLSMTVQMFPLHILASMAAGAGGAAGHSSPATVPYQELARSHQDITLLFME
jgi:hypothetical protein